MTSLREAPQDLIQGRTPASPRPDFGELSRADFDKPLGLSSGRRLSRVELGSKAQAEGSRRAARQSPTTVSKVPRFPKGAFHSLLRVVFLVTASFMLLALAGAPGAFAEDIIKIGFLAPLSGDVSRYGQDELNAARMAVEAVNSGGLIPGKKLRLVVEDGRCSGKEASVAAQRLVNVEKVPVILGGTCSGETLAAARITEPAKVILYTVFSSHPDISQAGRFIFRACVSDREGALLAAKLVLERGLRKIAVISETSDYALMFARIFEKAIGDSKEASVVASEEYNPAETDFRQIILRIRRKNPDVLLINPQSGAKGGLIVKQLRELGWEAPLFGTFAFSAPEAVQAAGSVEALEELEFVDAPSMRSARSREFIEEYTRRFPPPQSEFQTVLRYESVLVLAQALKSAGTNPEKIAEYLYGMPFYRGLEFSYHFNQDGDAVGLPYVVKRYEKGQVVMGD